MERWVRFAASSSSICGWNRWHPRISSLVQPRMFMAALSAMTKKTSSLQLLWVKTLQLGWFHHAKHVATPSGQLFKITTSRTTYLRLHEKHCLACPSRRFKWLTNASASISHKCFRLVAKTQASQTWVLAKARQVLRKWLKVPDLDIAREKNNKVLQLLAEVLKERECPKNVPSIFFPLQARVTELSQSPRTETRIDYGNCTS